MRTHYKLSGSAPPGPTPNPETGPITAGRNHFTDAAGRVWSYHGATAFLLYYRWLKGENVDPFIDWCLALRVNVVRVLGMVAWAGQQFGPTQTPHWWDELPRFIDHLAARGMRIEFVVFADAQVIMPSQDEQRVHLRRVLDTVGSRWNFLCEVANEPWQNGCDPSAIYGASEPRPCPMAYGDYTFEVHQRTDGVWIATLPVLGYVTVHTSRDADSWSRKAKDLAEYRDGAGDGLTPDSALWQGCHIAPVGDEPMGAAEASVMREPEGLRQFGGRQRSNTANDFFWYHANAEINGAGSTFHCDAGLQAVVPPPGGDQQRCAEASALAWANIEPEYQTGTYTRGGLSTLPLVWEEHYFPEQTSRIYSRLLGDRAVAVAIKPNQGWTPKAASGWKIVSVVGPQDSLVHLQRA